MSRKQYFNKTGIYNFTAQAVFFILLFMVGQNSHIPGSEIGQYVLILSLIAIPSVIWTLFFYLQDRHEPEPTRYIIASFLAGMAGAGLLALPLEQVIFRVNEWMYLSPLFLIVVAFLITGGVFSFIIHAIVRYGFYNSVEFDEPVDGMVYGAMAGSGFAFVSSLYYLLMHPEFTIFTMGYTATSNILMYASTGALVGHLSGAGKFSDKSEAVFSLAALLTGILTVGLFDYLQNLIFIEGFQQSFLYSFILTLAMAILVLIISSVIMNKLANPDRKFELSPDFKFDFSPLLLLLILLTLAGFTRNNAFSGIAFTDTERGISFYYPRTLSTLPDMNFGITSSEKVMIGDLVFSGRGYHEGIFSLEVKYLDKKSALEGLNLYDFTEIDDMISKSTTNTAVQGHNGVRLIYSYINRERASSEEFPVVNWAYLDIVPVKDKTYIFKLIATPANFPEARQAYTELLQSIQFINQE